MAAVNPLCELGKVGEAGKLFKEHRLYIVQSIKNEERTAVWWAKKLRSTISIDNTLINKWVSRYKQGKGISNTKGRPRHLEAEDITSLRRHIRESATKTKGVKRLAEVEHAIDNIATENSQYFHYGSKNKTINVSESTKKRVKICANIKNGYAELGTKALRGGGRLEKCTRSRCRLRSYHEKNLLSYDMEF